VTDQPRRVVIEADGGSRGNPGPAAYGALVRDADTGQVLAQRGETIGVATNNVAEYRGLIAGLEMAAEVAPGVEIEVRMDSKLVVEQMAGRWKIKHADMKPLAMQAQRLVSVPISWTWVPRAENKAADKLVNQALDGVAIEPPAAPESSEAAAERIGRTWRSRGQQTPTTVMLLRHGVTEHTVSKLFSGHGGADPGLTELGREQAARAAAHIARRGPIDAILSSPMQRTRETAAVVAEQLGLDVEIEPRFTEMAFGEWDGYGFGEVLERWPDQMSRWLESPTVAPPGGESMDSVYERVREARDDLLREHEGRTVVVVSHVTPIKMMVRLALDASVDVIHRCELSPASFTTVQWWPDGHPVIQDFSVVPD
jgi:probable phosphoglycerate mutase